MSAMSPDCFSENTTGALDDCTRGGSATSTAVIPTTMSATKASTTTD